MKKHLLTHREIDNPIYARLTADSPASPASAGESVGEGDLLIVDGASCKPAEIKNAFAPLDRGASVLLLDPTQEHKEALAEHIGFRSKGSSRGYFVSRLSSGPYRIIETGAASVAATNATQGAKGDKDGVKEVYPAQIEELTGVETNSLTDEEVDLYLDSLTEAVEEESPPPTGLVWQSWIYSRTHNYTASGSVNSDTGLGPPPSQNITLMLTYNFQAALNDATNTESFQYLGLMLTGIFQNNGMTNSSDTDYGWILADLNPSFAPDSRLNWVSSSPSNTNDVTQVTTGSSVTVGFEASGSQSGPSGGVNGSYTYSSSTTKNITDWYITQQTASEWLYGQATPYDGSTTSWSTVQSGCVNWYSGHINTSKFPTISTSSLQFAVEATWKTDSVVTDEVDISVSNHMQNNYIMIHETLGLGTSGAFWFPTSTPTDTFSINLGAVSQPPS